MRTIRDYIKNNRGQSMVEFALVVPMFVLLVMGIMEFGRVIHASMVVTNAARHGARTAAVVNDNDTIKTAATVAAATLAGELTVNISPAEEIDRSRGNPVTVTVTNKVEILTPLIREFFPDALDESNRFPVAGTATMRME